MSNLRVIVFHNPGPEWEPGLPLMQQVGVMEHRQHYAKLLEDGRLEMGGPFTDGIGGGMMIAGEGVTAEEMKAFAETDPAVLSGLLEFEIRTWLIGMRR